MSDAALPVGTIVAQRLKVIRVLGEGGMGAVYEVEHLLTKHRRALKLLHPNLASMPGVVERFLREASAAGRIGNAHIVETFDAGTTEEGAPYLVMELLDGYSLATHLERRGRLDPAEALEIFRQVCDGVQAAHDSGIVHRDLKPENIFLKAGQQRFVKILDFGISKFDPARTGMTTSTLEGSVLGTPFYMSPEQVRGARDVDAAADVYALGVVLYECLAGRRPFEAETLPHLAVLIAEGRYEAVSMRRPELPGALDAVISRALSADRRARFPSARAFAEALERVLEGSSLGNLATQYQAFSSIPPAQPAERSAPSEVVAYVPNTNVSAGTPAPVERSPQAQPGRRSSLPVLLGATGVIAALGVGFVLSRATTNSDPTPEAISAAARPSAPTLEGPGSAGRAEQKGPSVEAVVAPGLGSPEAQPSADKPKVSASVSAAAKASAPPAKAAAPPPSARRSSEHGLVEDNPFR